MSLTHRRRKEIVSLARKKGRARLEQLLVEGVRSVEAAVEAGAPLVEVVVTDAARADRRVEALLERVGGPVYVVADHVLVSLSDVATSQGVLAVARTTWGEEADLAACETILALDGVQDPGNVGTLIRTAAWFGVDAVLVGRGTADPFQPKGVRAAMGGLWDLRLVSSDDLGATLARLRAAGAACYGADLGGTPVTRWRPQRPSVLVLGSEAHGLSDVVQAVLDERVVIPGTPRRAGAESLNVAVAGGILVHAWTCVR